MKKISLFAVYLAFSSFILGLAAEPRIEPVVQRFEGTHQRVWLDLTSGISSIERPEKVSAARVQLIFRDGKLQNWWIVPLHWAYVHEHDSKVVLTDEGLRGDLSILLYRNKRKPVHTLATLSFDLKREENTFKGKVDIALSGLVNQQTTATATGSLADSPQSFATGSGWPGYAGPYGTLRAKAKGPELLDDLSKARPVWRSEVSTPMSYGNAADDRYIWKSAATRFAGGSGSPSVVDGVVYMAFYQPSRDWAPEVPTRWMEKFDPEHIEKTAIERKWTDAERKALEDHLRPIADDVVVAVDAQTGEALWRTVWPNRTQNVQTHKHRGSFGAPVVANGILVYPNLYGRLLAMDAKTENRSGNIRKNVRILSG